MANRTFTRLLVVLPLMAAAPAFAADDDDGTCRNGDFPAVNADFGVAIVTGDGHAHMLYDEDGCPGRSPQCETLGSGYVVPGDKVVTGRAKGEYVCAYYPSRGGGSAGWIEKARLRSVGTTSTPAVAAWLGRWSDENNPVVRITEGHGAFHIEGDAYWPGPVREKDWPPGWPHSGSIDGKLALAGNRASYDDGDCQIALVLLGEWLIARDNGMCVGANVRFDGVYRRARH
jgi:hypothetical protein